MKISLVTLWVVILMNGNAMAAEKYIENKLLSIKLSDDFLKSAKAYYVDDNENIYIFNVDSGMVDIYDKNGKLYTTIKTNLEYISGENVDITTNEHGDILIYNENVLKIYNKQGNLIKEINRKMYPQTLMFSDGAIYSMDTGDVIYEITPNAKPLKQNKHLRDYSWSSDSKYQGKSIPITDKKEGRKINVPFEVVNSGSNNYNFQRIKDIDKAGNIYVNYESKTEKTKNMIVKYDKNGNLLAKFKDWPVRINQQTEAVYNNKIENGFLSFYKWEKVK